MHFTFALALAFLAPVLAGKCGTPFDTIAKLTCSASGTQPRPSLDLRSGIIVGR